MYVKVKNMTMSANDIKEKYEKIAGDTRRHHWVPQMHLRSFSPENEEGRVYMYEAGKNPVLVSVADVAVSRDLYTFREITEGKKTRVFEGIFSEHESEVARVLKKIKELETIPESEEDRSHLASFVSMLHVRGPSFSDWLRNMEAEYLELSLRVQASHPESFREKLEKSGTTFASDQEFEDVLKYATDPDRPRVEMTGGEEQYFKQAMQISKDLYYVLMGQKSWHLLVAPQGRHFITSDHPVVIQEIEGCPPHLAGGFLNGTVLLTISPKLCLAFRRIPLKSEHVNLNRSDVNHINESIAKAGRRQIYSHVKSKDVASLCTRELTGDESRVTVEKIVDFAPYYKVTGRSNLKEVECLGKNSVDINSLANPIADQDARYDETFT